MQRELAGGSIGKGDIMLMFENNKKVTVFRWELDYLSNWTIESLRNWIWMSKQNGQPIPGCVSVEALRMELVRRGEPPVGYHENADEINMKNIVVEDSRPLPKRRGR